MFLGSTAPSEGLAIWLFTSGVNTDADWGAYCAAIRAAARELSAHASPVALQIVETASSDPNARWRREIAAAMKEVPAKARVFIVTRSTMLRHGLTAIRWLWNPDFAIEILASEAEAFARLEQRGPPAKALLAGLRRKAPTGP